MMRALTVVFAVLGGALSAGCEAIADFGPFHVVTPDSGPSFDSATGDLASTMDLVLSDLVPLPDMTVFPASCMDIRKANPNTIDGSFMIYLDGDPTKPWVVYCGDLAGQPKEYLQLAKVGPDKNFSQYTVDGMNPGTNVRTNYTRLRIDPKTLIVDVDDQAYSTSSGMFDFSGTHVTSMPFAAAMNCTNPVVATGIGNIDLQGTVFAVPPNSFALNGNAPAGSATYSANNQVVDLTGGGACGWIAPLVSQPPLNMTGGASLPLQYLALPVGGDR